MHSGECEYTLKKRLTLARLARLKMKNHIYLKNNSVIANMCDASSDGVLPA